MKYDPAFKAQAVARVRAAVDEAGSVAAATRQVAEDMRLSASTLRGWVRDAPAVIDPAPDTDDATLEGQLDAAVRSMKWLEKSDDALVKLGRTYAAQIDRALTDPEVGTEARTKALYLGPHLLGVLRELGGTPGTRKELTRGEESVGGKLAALRAVETGRKQA